MKNLELAEAPCFCCFYVGEEKELRIVFFQASTVIYKKVNHYKTCSTVYHS